MPISAALSDDGLDHLLAGAFLELDPDASMAGEKIAEIDRQMLDDGRHAGGHADLAAHPLGMVAKFGLHLLEIAKQDAGMMEKRLGGWSWLQALRAPVEERRLDHLLQVGDPLAHRRGGDVQFLRGACDAFILADRDEQLQGQQIESHEVLALFPARHRQRRRGCRSGRCRLRWPASRSIANDDGDLPNDDFSAFDRTFYKQPQVFVASPSAVVSI